MTPHLPTDACGLRAQPSSPVRAATMFDLSSYRALKRAEMQAALEQAIIQSVQHIDIVRLFELKEEREARQRALQT